MRVFGVLVVRNAVDLVRVAVLHHLSLGIERVLVVDNGSSDGTTRVLRRLARRHPVSFTVDEGPFDQAELTTGLVHEAARAGADWVVPFDADELLTGDEPLRDVLWCARPDGLLVEVLTFVQRSDRLRASPRALLTMTMRPRDLVDPVAAIARGRAGEISIVEAAWPRKLVLRPTMDVRLHVGNHGADGVERLELCDRIRYLHAPLRARSVLALRAEHARRIRAVRSNPDQGWQQHRILVAAERGLLDEEWRANSYLGAHLQRKDARRAVVPDERLRQAAMPWVRSPARRALTRLREFSERSQERTAQSGACDDHLP
jgi:hypothetical protein